MAGLDRERRYLRPVARLQLPDQPDVVHLALYAWEPRFEEWVTGMALCGASAEQGALPEATAVTCEGCLGYQPQYEAVLAKESDTPPVRERVAARRDPRYAVVLAEVSGFGWPNGQPMVPGTWAETLTTRIVTAVRAAEAQQKMTPVTRSGGNRR